MKTIILAGGYGTRLRPVTRNRPKPLLPLGERPIIDHIVEDISEHSEIIISTNTRFKQDFQSYADSKEAEITVFEEKQNSEDEKPGTIGGIIKLLEELEIQDDILIIGGDNYFGFDIDSFIDFSKKMGSSVAAKKVSYDRAPNFGILSVKGNKVSKFKEKPQDPESNLASTACYYFKEEDLSLFTEYLSHIESEELDKRVYLDAPGMLLEYAVERADIHCYQFEEKWFDIGTPEGYIEAVSSIQDAQALQGKVKDSEVSNSILSEGSEVNDSTIENCIIFEDVKIEGSVVRNCIVDSGSELDGVELEDCVLGKDSVVQ